MEEEETCGQANGAMIIYTSSPALRVSRTPLG